MRFLLFVGFVVAFFWGALGLLASPAAKGLPVDSAVAGLAAIPILFVVCGWVWSLLRRPRK